MSDARYVAAQFRLVVPTVVTRYYHLDALGSVRAVTNADGSTARRDDYLVFGEGGTPPMGDSIRFTGKERDAETALDYFGARYYRNLMGRFTTVDPVLPVEDALLSPQRWNRYSYVMNRPLVLTDPDGRCPSCIFLLFQKAAEAAQRLASSPAVKRAGHAILNQASRAWLAGTRLFNTPTGQELDQTGAELATGADIGPTVGAVIGHLDAGYAKVGRELGAAVFDIPIAIWNRMSPDQRERANKAFLDGINKKRLTVQVVVTHGVVRPKSTLSWEIDYLLAYRYTFSRNGDRLMLLPPK